jgi:hypothetical protein
MGQLNTGLSQKERVLSDDSIPHCSFACKYSCTGVAQRWHQVPGSLTIDELLTIATLNSHSSYVVFTALVYKKRKRKKRWKTFKYGVVQVILPVLRTGILLSVIINLFKLRARWPQACNQREGLSKLNTLNR